MHTSNKYKPARSCVVDRRQNRSMWSRPRNRHSYEVNKTWRRFRFSFKKLALKGRAADVINQWQDGYKANVYMPYTD